MALSKSRLVAVITRTHPYGLRRKNNKVAYLHHTPHPSTMALVGGVRVVNAKNFGVFVELEPGITGLISANGLPLGFGKLGQFMPNERLIVEIQNVFPMKRRMSLTYVGEAPEESSSDDSQMYLALSIDEADTSSAVDEGE